MIFKRLVMKYLLTEREKEVLNLIIREYTTGEIANILCLSSDTIKSHRKNLLAKMQVRNTAGLVRSAFEHQLYSYNYKTPKYEMAG